MKTLRAWVLPLLASSALAVPAEAEDIAIVGATVYTLEADEPVENGVVLIHDGKITAAGGPATEVPAGYRVIEAAGMVVTPGLMSAFSQIGAEEIGLESSTVNQTIEETFINAAFEVAPGVNPNSATLAVARSEGVTRAVVVPGTALFASQSPNKSVFTGQAAYMHLGKGMNLVLKSDAAEVAYLETNRGTVGTARGAVLAYLKGTLAEAAPKKGAGGGGKFIKSDADRAVLAKVVAGDMPLYLEENQASFILQLLDLKKEFKNLKLVLFGAAEAWMVAKEIAAAGVPVVLSADQNLPGSFTSLGSSLYAAARLEQAGVTIAIVATNGLAHQADLLRQNAGIAVAHGMSWAGALKAITLNPAKIIGADAAYGTLAVGKDADVVVWDGDPLEVMTLPVHVFIRGEEQSLESRQTKLRDRYRDLGTPLPSAYKK